MEVTFALIVTVLLFNLTCLVRIHYGDAIITHITTRPYKITMVLLILMLSNHSIGLVITNIVYVGRYSEYIEDLKSKPFFIFLLDLPYQLKWWLIMCFFISRTSEMEILGFFVRYQGNLKLQNLDVARDHY